MTCPWTELYHMRLRALRFGTYVQSVSHENDGNVILETLTDGTVIQLTVDPDTLTYELKRFIPEDNILLYSQSGTYEPESEEESEYVNP